MRRLFLIVLSISTLSVAKAQPNSSSQSSSSSSMNKSIQEAREQEAAYKAMQEKNPNEKPWAKVGAKLPAFHAVTWDEKSFFSSDLNPKKPLILVLYNPGCGHCVDMGKMLKDSMSVVKNAEIVFVAAKNQLGELKTYATETGLNEKPEVIVSAENTELNKYLFEYNGMPQIMVYNKDKVLQKTFYKYVTIDSLKFYTKTKK